MHRWFFRAAAALSGFGLLAHEFFGAPKVLGPLDSAGLPEPVVWLHHFSWHVGTIATATLSAMFFFASTTGGRRPLAVFATAMSLGFAALGVGLALGPGSALWETPAPYVWSLVTLLGSMGLWTSRERLREAAREPAG
ncbi:MAG: hypothetical protein AAGA81_18250 [Acidobacteriota bacterium]